MEVKGIRSYILARLAGLLVVAVMGLLLAVQTPKVQTWLSRKAIERFSGKFDGNLSCGEIGILPSGALILRDVLLLDGEPYTEDIHERGWEPVDTVFHARSISATFSLKSIFDRKGIHSGRLDVHDAFFHLTLEPGEYKTNITRIFRIKTKAPDRTPGPEIFDIRKAVVDGVHYRMQSFNPVLREDLGDYAINYDDMDIVVSAKASRLKFTGNRMYGKVDELIAEEKCGMRIDALSGSFAVGMGKTRIDNIHYRDSLSDIRLKYYEMNYDSPLSFDNYISEVRMQAAFKPSVVAMETIDRFAGSLPDNRSVFEVESGEFEGYVNDFKLEDFRFTDSNSKLSGELDCRIIGLPDVEAMLTDIQVNKLNFTLPALGRFISGFGVQFPSTAYKYARGVFFNLNAGVSGPLNRLKISGNLSSNSGRLKLSGDIRNALDPRRAVQISAALNATDLDAGKLSGVRGLGKCSFFTELGATLRPGIPDLRVDSLSVSSFQAFGYDYSGISAKAYMDNGTATLKLLSSDPAISLSLDALADLSPKIENKRYRVDAKVDNIDLYALNIDKRGISRLSFDLDGDVIAKGGFFDGRIDINGLALENTSARNGIGDIHFKAYRLGIDQYFTMEAPFARMSASGERGFYNLPADLQYLTARKELPALYSLSDAAEDRNCGHYDFRLETGDSRKLCSFLLPGLFIAEGSSAEMEIGDNGDMYFNVDSPLLAYGNNFLRSANLSLDNFDDALRLLLEGENIRLNHLDMSRPRINLSADSNNFALGLNFERVPGISEGGDFLMDGLIYRDSLDALVLRAHPLESFLSVGESVWSLSESDISVRGSDLFVDKLSISNGPQSIQLDGGISRDRSDTLFLKISDVDISVIDEFLPQAYDIRGKLNGMAFLDSELGRALGMLADIRLDSLSIAGADAGNLRISGILEDDGEDLEIFVSNELGGINSFYANGLYYLDDGRMDISAEFNRLGLKPAGAFLKDIFESLDGSLSGKLRLQGNVGGLNIESQDLRLENVGALLAMTGVQYYVDGPVRLANDGIHFDQLSIRDDSWGRGSFNGVLNHRHLSEFSLNSRVEVDNMKFVDAQEEKGRSFYGLLRGGGYADIRGPLDALEIEGSVHTQGDGNVHIPMGGATASTSNLLSFTDAVKEIDPYDEMMNTLAQEMTRSSDISIKANVNVHSGVKAYVEIDKSSGNVASFSGSGSVSIALRPKYDQFKLNGDFNISEGNYQFAIPGVLSKDFSVQEGSSIKFGGDLLDTELDVQALYKLKASLDPLLTDKSSEGLKRNVECGITISDRLKNPRISFSIDVPDLNPTTRAQVESSLSTEDKVQKQFLALLLMGSFIPDESSGVFNSSDVLLSNVTGLMANQLNSILQKLEIPVDVGIGYQGLADGNNVFDVAISTQLFNNRVIVGGSVANRKYNNSAGNGDMIGDLDIQIKLDPEGKFRFNLFSHSADEYSSYLDLSQRNGVGLSYQKEYTKLGQFFRSIFRKKGKEEESTNREQTIIKIEKDDKQGETLPDTDSAGR